MKHVCSSLLIFLFLFSVVSAEDDQLSLADLFLNANSGDEAIVAPSHARDRDCNCVLTSLLDQLDHAQIDAVFTHVPEATFRFWNCTVAAGFCDPYVAVPSER